MGCVRFPVRVRVPRQKHRLNGGVFVVLFILLKTRDCFNHLIKFLFCDRNAIAPLQSFWKGVKMARIERIVTHKNPHLDEIVALWLLRRFGERVFLGASRAPLWTIEITHNLPEKENELLIGVGGGRFDDHYKNGKRKKGECAATLVADALSIRNDPALSLILEETRKADTNRVSSMFHLANLVKVWHRTHPENYQEIIDLVFRFLESVYIEQQSFFFETKQEIEKNGKLEEIRGGQGKIVLAVVVSENSQVSAAARKFFGAGVIIQKNPQTGHVQIFTNHKDHIRLNDVARVINIREQELDEGVRITDWNLLEQEGQIPGGRWYYFKKGEMLLNGGPNARNVPPTRIPLEEIVRLVKMALDPKCFETTRALLCSEGVCSSTPENPCPWYKFGLTRCRKIRFRESQSKQR